MSTVGSVVASIGLRVLSPVRQARDRVAVLHCVDRVVVRGAVGLGASDDPHVRRRGVDHLDAVRDGPVPARRDDREIVACVPLVRLPGTANASVHMS